MDFSWITDAVVVPIVSAVVGLVATVAAPLLTSRAVRYLNRRWKLDIDAKEQARVEALATEVVFAVEAQLKGPGRSAEKMAAAVRELTTRATQAGLVIGEDAARAKLEKVLGREGFTGPYTLVQTSESDS